MAEGFVVDQDGTDGHAASRFGSSSWNGISISTRNPPSWVGTRLKAMVGPISLGQPLS